MGTKKTTTKKSRAAALVRAEHGGAPVHLTKAERGVLEEALRLGADLAADVGNKTVSYGRWLLATVFDNDASAALDDKSHNRLELVRRAGGPTLPLGRRMLYVRSICLGACALVVACGGAPSSVTPAGAMSDDDEIFAVVIFHDLEQASLASGEAVCVGARGATSDGTALLAAIRSRYPTAVPDGQCSGGGPDGPVVVTATRGKAVRIDIGPIEWAQEQGRARIVSGGAYRGGGVREVEYALEKHGSKWQITGTKTKIQT